MRAADTIIIMDSSASAMVARGFDPYEVAAAEEDERVHIGGAHRAQPDRHPERTGLRPAGGRASGRRR